MIRRHRLWLNHVFSAERCWVCIKLWNLSPLVFTVRSLIMLLSLKEELYHEADVSCVKISKADYFVHWSIVSLDFCRITLLNCHYYLQLIHSNLSLWVLLANSMLSLEGVTRPMYLIFSFTTFNNCRSDCLRRLTSCRAQISRFALWISCTACSSLWSSLHVRTLIVPIFHL